MARGREGRASATLCVGLAAALVGASALPSLAEADVPPFGPQIAWHFRIETTDIEHVWVAYPINRSRGVPSIAYERVEPGEGFDPGRGAPALHAFPRDQVGLVASDPVGAAPSAAGLEGAPRAFGVGAVPSGGDPLADFLEAAHVPRSEPLTAPIDPALTAARVVAVIDTLAPSIERGRIVLRLVRTEYAFDDRAAETLDANADGTRAIPLPPTPAPPVTPSETASSDAPAARPEVVSSSWACHAGPGRPAPIAGLALLAMLVATIGRRQSCGRNTRQERIARPPAWNTRMV